LVDPSFSGYLVALHIRSQKLAIKFINQKLGQYNLSTSQNIDEIEKLATLIQTVLHTAKNIFPSYKSHKRAGHD